MEMNVKEERILKIRWLYPFLFALILIGCSAKTEMGKEAPEVTKTVTKEKLNLTASPTFEMSTKNDLGETITGTFIGIKGHLAVIDSPLSVNQPQKVMWLLWEEMSNPTLKSMMKVIATNEDGEQITVVETTLMGENWGAPAHTPSLVNLPKKGLWKMDVFVNDKKFGDLTVNVAEKLEE